MLAQILDYTASANNEQRRSKTGSCELSRLGSSEATERLGLQSARAAMREDMENSQSCLHELRTLHVFSRSAATMPERSSGIWAARSSEPCNPECACTKYACSIFADMI